MIIPTTTYNRYRLSAEEKEFFLRIIPLAKLISDWTYHKADFAGVPSPYGMAPSLVCAEIFLKSDFGKHPLSQANYNNKYSNNLTLMEVSKNWKGKAQDYEDKQYKAFKDWYDFATEYSDYICFSGNFNGLLNCYLLLDQVKFLSLTNSNPIDYNSKLISTIKSYGLEEIDGW